MYVKGLSRAFLGFSTLLILAACTNKTENAPADTTAASNTGSGAKGAIAGETVEMSACYYAPLPGAFRLYCPDFKSADGRCSSRGDEVDVSYTSGAESRSAVGRGLTSSEKAAVPDACFAVDLPLLPNADNKLTYKLGGRKFEIMAYLPFGNGAVP